MRLDGIGLVHGDRYAGEWPREQFLKRKVEYKPSERVKSDIYRDALPLLNSGRVQLLDNKRLIAQLHGLERRTARGGKDSIDHGPGRHDDVANAAAGALVFGCCSGWGLIHDRHRGSMLGNVGIRGRQSEPRFLSRSRSR